jgi:Na+/H+ antiporter NhaD/arsenite permease-like protein
VVVAAFAGPLIADLAAYIPKPGADVGGLLLALVVGAALAGVLNNLPAAALGTVWLVASPAPAIIAFLIGTNIAVVATPHGSVATMLAHGVGRRQGVVVEVPTYLRSAWRYGLVGSAAALAALLLTVLLA